MAYMKDKFYDQLGYMLDMESYSSNHDFTCV